MTRIPPPFTPPTHTEFAVDLKLITVLLALCDIIGNPRSRRDPAYIRGLSENIKAVGQKVAIIGYWKDGRFNVADGGCRVEAMRMAGKSEALALDLGHAPPGAADLLMAQASIDLHKANLPPVDRGRLYDSIIKTRGITARQVAQELGVSESLISHHRDLLALAPDLQEQVNAGALAYSKTFVIVKEPDFVKQRELAVVAAEMSSQELRAKVRRQKTGQAGKPEERTARIKLAVGGCTVTISGARGLSIADAIDAVAGAEKELKSGRDRGLTAKTISRMAAEKVAAQRAKADGV